MSFIPMPFSARAYFRSQSFSVFISIMAGRVAWNLIKNRYKCIFMFNFHSIKNKKKLRTHTAHSVAAHVKRRECISVPFALCCADKLSSYILCVCVCVVFQSIYFQFHILSIEHKKCFDANTSRTSAVECKPENETLNESQTGVKNTQKTNYLTKFPIWFSKSKYSEYF